MILTRHAFFGQEITPHHERRTQHVVIAGCIDAAGDTDGLVFPGNVEFAPRRDLPATVPRGDSLVVAPETRLRIRSVRLPVDPW